MVDLFSKHKSTPLIIAELSANHNGSLDKALAIVEAAANAGAHAVKLQTYTADTMTLDVDLPEFLIEDEKSLWNGRKLYELYQEAHTPWDWQLPIVNRANELGLSCFSTPFDHTAVDFLESIGMPAYKIASFENTDLELIKSVAKTGKPILMSTGMATLEELELSVRVARENGCKELVLLKCTSSYPASPEDSHILTLPDMRRRFGCQVGLSDHTLGLGAAVAAVAHGAILIEKHFTLSRKDGGVDAQFSLEPEQMRQLVEETRQAQQALGEVKYGSIDSESGSLQFKRSIYLVKDIEAGSILDKKSVRCIRPGYGLAPKYLLDVLGRKINCSAKRGTPLSWDMLGAE